MRKELFSLSLLLFSALMLVTTGFSGDDEEKEDSSIKVDFRLQDANGSECYEFHEGDNIVFRLEIKNNTNEIAISLVMMCSACIQLMMKTWGHHGINYLVIYVRLI